MKIEKQICGACDSAMHNHCDGAKLSSRDEVVFHSVFKSVYYYLHGNCIFWYNQKQQQFGFSLRGYNTVTTRSRLRALLGYFFNSDLYMRKGKIYVSHENGVTEINPNDIYYLRNNEIKLIA